MCAILAASGQACRVGKERGNASDLHGSDSLGGRHYYLCHAELTQAKELFFVDAKLTDDLTKQPAADFGVAVRGDGRRAPIWVLPASVAALLASFLEAELSRDTL